MRFDTDVENPDRTAQYLERCDCAHAINRYHRVPERKSARILPSATRAHRMRFRHAEATVESLDLSPTLIPFVALALSMFKSWVATRVGNPNDVTFTDAQTNTNYKTEPEVRS